MKSLEKISAKVFTGILNNQFVNDNSFQGVRSVFSASSSGTALYRDNSPIIHKK